jgi:hypothetical protein
LQRDSAEPVHPSRDLSALPFVEDLPDALTVTHHTHVSWPGRPRHFEPIAAVWQLLEIPVLTSHGAAMNRLEGRVALVTGAASGIGKATSQRLTSEGAAGEATVKELNEAGGRAAFFKHDVTSEADWEAACASAVEEFGALDPGQQRRLGRHQADRGDHLG